MNFSYLFKCIVIGDQSVGKSSIVMQFIDSSFRGDCEPTVGVEFASKTLTLGNQIIKLQIWDTAGQQAFQSITRSYYRGTIGAILVFDVTSRRSFENLSKWLQETRNYATNDSVVVMLVANKIDMKVDRQVSQEEGKQWAEENDLLFVECSAKRNVNVGAVFQRLGLEVLRRIKAGLIDVGDEHGGVKLGDYHKQELPNVQRKCC